MNGHTRTVRISQQKQLQQKKLEAQLLAGLASGRSIAMNRREWKKLQTELERRLTTK